MSGNALQVINVDLTQPPTRPKGVTPKQWRLALLYPRCETAYEAAILAGYKPSTAAARAGRMSAAIGTLRAAQAQQAAELDSASKVFRGAGAELAKRVEAGMRDEALIMAWKTAADVKSSGVSDAAAAVSQAERDNVKEYMARVVAAAYQLGFATAAPHNQAIPPTISAQVIDTVLLAAETQQVTYCALSDIEADSDAK